MGYLKPPPTTKVGLTAKGGYQAEIHFFLCGLDIEEKAAMLERQVRHRLDESKYHCLKFRTNGRCPNDPKNQDSATVDVRIFAQAKNESDLSLSSFFRPVTDTIMQTYPGATFAVDARQATPKPYFEYWVSIIPQADVKHVAYLPSESGLEIPIPAPTDTVDFQYEQDTYEPRDPINVASLGPTTRAPLGYVMHARSGDKGSDCNVGFFARHADEWDWLRSLLTTDKVRELLGEDDTGKPIFRFELPNIWGVLFLLFYSLSLQSSLGEPEQRQLTHIHYLAVHFLLKDHLDRGVSSSSTYDVLGKNLAEYLRCKLVDIPDKFLGRGRI